MQTFLPVESFVKSMEALDAKRLGKQRVEAAQILEIILKQPILPKNMKSAQPFDPSNSDWANHPAVKMWRGYDEWLKYYLACAVGEWVYRGYSNTITPLDFDITSDNRPAWLGYEPFHASHRSNLLRKYPVHYRKLWPDEPDDLGYFWPTKCGFPVPPTPKRILLETA